MKKYLIILSMGMLVMAGGNAMDIPNAPGDSQHAPQMQIFENLTEEQRACISKFGCEMPGAPDENSQPPMPGNSEKPEMTDEQRANMECMRQAMTECGIELPTPPAGPGMPDAPIKMPPQM